MKKFQWFVVAVMLQAFNVAAQDAVEVEKNESQIFLTYNSKAPYIFMGKIDADKAASAGAAMMYPGDNALVFFTAVLAHAAIESGVQNSRSNKVQNEANQVLVDYQPLITKFNVVENILVDKLDLMGTKDISDIYISNDEASKASAKWIMNVSPVFFLTQNHGSLILYNHIVLDENKATDSTKKNNKKTVSKKAKEKRNEKIVVVISDPIKEDDYKNYWLKSEGLNFLTVLKKMYDESIELIVAHKIKQKNEVGGEQTTIRYIEDGVKKIERGYVYASSCQRTLFESLEGEIKSVPNLDFLNCPLGG